METPHPPHFKDKDAIGHVAEVQAKGMISSTEIHGTEMPGTLAAATDAAKDTAVMLLLLWASSSFFIHTFTSEFQFLFVFSIGWLLWKFGRSAWLGWSHLERLHRIVNQEKWEIEHHREQEREELKVLYNAKGFSGKLLDDVVDVLMADGDRLLRVMVQEELGLSIECYDHPLKQGIGAAIGCFLTMLASFLCFYAFPAYGLLIGSLASIAGSSFLAAKYEQNRTVPAIIWNVGIGLLAGSFVYFFLEFLRYFSLTHS